MACPAGDVNVTSNRISKKGFGDVSDSVAVGPVMSSCKGCQAI